MKHECNIFEDKAPANADSTMQVVATHTKAESYRIVFSAFGNDANVTVEWKDKDGTKKRYGFKHTHSFETADEPGDVRIACRAVATESDIVGVIVRIS